MKIDRRTLNFNFTVTPDDGHEVYLHVRPLSREVFNRYFMVLTQTYAYMLEQGPVWLAASGQRTASLILRQKAEEMRVGDDVERGLMAEIRRLSSVFVLGNEGWQMMPLQSALDRKLFSEDDAVEVENTIVFFIACSASATKEQANDFLGLFEERLTSLSPSDYRSSLPILMPVEDTTTRVTQSTIPV